MLFFCAKRLGCSAAICLLCLVSASLRAWATPYVSAALETPAVITQGEPIALRYTITNTDAAQPVSVYLGDQENGFFRLSLLPTLSSQSPPMTAPYNSHGGLQSIPIYAIAPGDKLTHNIVVSSYFRSIPPGTYTVRLQTYLSYAATKDSLQRESDADQARFYPPSREEKHLETTSMSNLGTPFSATYTDQDGDTPLLNTQEFKLKLVVQPADHAMLAAKANALAAAFDGVWNSNASPLAEAELFAMPAEDAAPAWRDVAKSRRYEVTALRAYPSPQAADIIAGLVDDKTTDVETHAFAAQALSYMYDLATPGSATQAYIKRLIAQRNLTILPLGSFLFSDD